MFQTNFIQINVNSISLCIVCAGLTTPLDPEHLFNYYYFLFLLKKKKKLIVADYTTIVYRIEECTCKGARKKKSDIKKFSNSHTINLKNMTET